MDACYCMSDACWLARANEVESNASKSVLKHAMETTTGERQPLTAAEKKIKVLVPIDDSEESFCALRWALDHVLSYSPADQDPNDVTLVHVHPAFQPFVYPAGPVVYATPAVIDGVKKAQEQNAARILSQALNICKEKKVKAETLILEGDAKDRICQTAEQLHVDLVVLGSRGLGSIKRALLGSVSDYCAHHLLCPILIVKPPAKTAHQ